MAGSSGETVLRRRELVAAGLRLGACAVAGAWASVPASAAWAALRTPERSLAFYHTHTGERLRCTYWADGSYLPAGLHELDHFLRDFRTGEVKPIDERLLDLLHAVHARLETCQPFHLISGYRCAATNQALAEQSGGVARRSLHMEGMAADVRVPGRATGALRRVALDLRQGGVGYYPASDFVHVDVGRVRTW